MMTNAEKYQRTKVKTLARLKARYAANPDKFKERVRRYKADNSIRIKTAAAEYQHRTRHAVNARTARYYASKTNSRPCWANESNIAEMYAAARAATELLGISVHVDHIVPLRSRFVCGLHCAANLQLLPGIVNRAKANRIWPGMWGAA